MADVEIEGQGTARVAAVPDDDGPEVALHLPTLRRSDRGDSTWCLPLWPAEARRLAVALLTAAGEADGRG